MSLLVREVNTATLDEHKTRILISSIVPTIHSLCQLNHWNLSAFIITLIFGCLFFSVQLWCCMYSFYFQAAGLPECDHGFRCKISNVLFHRRNLLNESRELKRQQEEDLRLSVSQSDIKFYRLMIK